MKQNSAQIRRHIAVAAALRLVVAAGLGLAVTLSGLTGDIAGAQEAQETETPADVQVPAEVDPFRLVISRWDDATIRAYSAFGNVSEKYGSLDRSRGETILFTVGSIHQSVARTSHPDWLVAIDGMIGRGFILLRDYENAQGWLESALAIGQAGGHADESLNGVLRDLAWLARQRGDEAAAAAYAARAETCPIHCGADILWVVSREGEKFAEEARSILGDNEFWRRRADERRRDAEVFVRQEFGEESVMMARLLQVRAGEVTDADPDAALGLIERSISLFRQNGAELATILSARLSQVQIVAASGDAARAAGLASELMADAATESEPDAIWIALDAAEKRHALLGESGSTDVPAAYADAVTLAVWAGGDRPVHRRLLEAGIAVGFDRDASRLADGMLFGDPANDFVLPLRLTLAERLGEQAEIERLNAILNPAPGREPTEREIALARIEPHIGVVESLPEKLLEQDDRVSRIRAKGFRRSAFSMHAAFARLGSRDDTLLAEAIVARGDLMGRRYGEAERRYSAVLAEAERRGWNEARLSSIVSDLAFLAEQTGRAEAADAWRQRAAAACIAPCNEALFREVWIEARLARMLVEKVFSDGDRRRELDSFHEDAIAYMDANHGSAAAETIDAWQAWASASRSRDDRPWQTIDLHQRLMELRLSAGGTPGDLLDVRRVILEELLKAGEHRRMVDFADALIVDARAAGDAETVIHGLQHRARALWHLGEPSAREVYRELIASIDETDGAEADARLLLQLVDARFEPEIVAVADRLLAQMPGQEWPLIAKARILADQGDPAAAAELLAGIGSPSRVALLQRAHFLELGGDADAAAAIRREAIPPDVGAEASGMDGVFARFNKAINPWVEIQGVIDPRDFGAFEGAAAAALAFVPLAEEWIRAGQYVHAQMLWQIAYTLARGGEADHAFRLMKAAAGIAVSHSFADANATDGGSLQLLRRDKFRYLLFVDIAWAHVIGQAPGSMSMSSRY